MKHGVTVLTLVLAAVIAMPLAAADKEKKKGKKKNKNQPQVTAVLKKLDKVELNEEQSAKLKVLTADFNSKIAAARETLGDGQKKVTESRKKAVADGKKGKAIQVAIVASLNEEEQKAHSSLQELNAGFRTSVAKLLDDEQREAAGLRVGRTKKKKKAE